MSAYAIPAQRRSLSSISTNALPSDVAPRSGIAETARCAVPLTSEGSILDALIADFTERIAAAVAAQLTSRQEHVAPEWLDSRGAAEYLGVHRDTLRKLAAERAICAHQDGPGCKLFFRRSDLDEWRLTGGRVVHLASVLADVA